VANLLILIGSQSDREHFEGIDRLAAFFGLTYALEVISAHRNSEQLRERLSAARTDGTQVIIAAAGMAAHLAGVCAAESTLPVIGVPLPGSSLNGVDALLATVQMPAGVPVATMAIGKAGAQNAIIFAARMLAVTNAEIRTKLEEFRSRGSRL
jgi:5-(carboxyamino)imidazole ribonucleotide mutase